MIEIQGDYTRYIGGSLYNARVQWEVSHQLGKITVECHNDEKYCASVKYDDGSVDRITIVEQQQANESIMQEYDEDFLNTMASEPKEEEL